MCTAARRRHRAGSSREPPVARAPRRRHWEFAPAATADGVNRPAAIRHDRWAHIIQRPLVRARRVGMSRMRIEPRHAVPQRHAQPRHGNSCAKRAAVRERERRQITVSIRRAQADRPLIGPRSDAHWQRLLRRHRFFNLTRCRSNRRRSSNLSSGTSACCGSPSNSNRSCQA